MKRNISLRRYTFPLLVITLLMLAPALITQPEADGGPDHRVRTLQFGSSGGNVNDQTRRFCCSGTLGSLVQDSNSTQYILSNNHVMGLSGRASAGDDISQPGLIDSNCQVSTVVADFSVAPPLSSNVDAAIAQLRPGQMDSTGSILDIGTISSVVRAPAVGLGVKKSGRTTGFTTGSITSINTTVSVRYPRNCGSGGGSTFTFTNQVVVGGSGFSAGGDSGSLIVTNNSCAQPVALLFAGSSTSTIGNPAGQVLTRLSTSLGRAVNFVGGTCTSAALLERRRQAPDDEAIQRVTAIKESRETNLLLRPGVIGVGVGMADEDQSEGVIVIYVDERIGAKTRLPRQINGVKVRTIYTDPFVAF